MSDRYLSPAEAARRFPEHVIVSDSLARLYEADRRRTYTLLCRQRGLWSEQLEAIFSVPTWAAGLFADLKMPEGAHWLFALDRLNERPATPDDLLRVRHASGVHGAPRDNLRLTWSIRAYSERSSTAGDLPWLQRLHALNANGPPAARAISHGLLQLSTEAAACGAGIIIEQLSIILSKSTADQTRTLTPHVHADEYYGHRETAIASLLESGCNPAGGTLFLPTQRMAALDLRGTVDITDIDRKLSDVPLMATRSGDVCIYDGMLTPAGEKDPHQGVPHVSADIQGRSARLVVLMRHRSPLSQ